VQIWHFSSALSGFISKSGPVLDLIPGRSFAFLDIRSLIDVMEAL
jgi:hypothetical protein